MVNIDECVRSSTLHVWKAAGDKRRRWFLSLTYYCSVLIVNIADSKEVYMLTDYALDHCTDYDRQVLTEIDQRLTYDETTGCMLFTGLTQGGTPMRSYGGKRISVRKLVHQLCIGTPATRLTTTCGNDRCVALEHMTHWTGPKTPAGRDPILTVDQRAEIMATPKVRGSGVELAERFGVSGSTISKVRSKRKPKETAATQEEADEEVKLGTLC